MYLTKKQAITDSLIKWEHAKNTGCNDGELSRYLIDNYSYIYWHEGGCGLCEKYYGYCEKCLLYKKWGIDCMHKNSPHYKWYHAKRIKTRKKYATIIYNDIRGL